MSGASGRPAPGGGRHRAREVALQVLFALDLGRAAADAPSGGPGPEEGDRAFDRVTEHFDVPSTAAAFARELVREVWSRREALDATVGAHARNWRVERMAAVDRNVLRLAVYELGHTETPIAVVIDEAVDLARRFGGDASPGFVNGVLDAAAREIRAA